MGGPKGAEPPSIFTGKNILHPQSEAGGSTTPVLKFSIICMEVQVAPVPKVCQLPFSCDRLSCQETAWMTVWPTLSELVELRVDTFRALLKVPHESPIKSPICL